MALGRGNGLGGIFVDTIQSAEAFRRIDELREYGWQRGYCQGLLLLGPARSGKTHMVHNYLDGRFPGWDEEAPEVGRVVMLEVQSGCTLKSVAADLLAKLNDPNPEYGAMTAKMQRAIQAMAGRIELIVFDEVQRLIDTRTDRVLSNVAGWMTDLLNRRVAPILFVGEEKARPVFTGSDHLWGRTRGEVTVSAYKWEVAEERQAFCSTLWQLGKELGQPDEFSFGKLGMARLIHEFSGGRLGLAAMLVDGALTTARRDGGGWITPTHFEQAADDYAKKGDLIQPNPFRTVRLMTEGKVANQDAAVLAIAPATAVQERRSASGAAEGRGRPRGKAS